MGKSKMETFIRIIIPLSKRGLITGGVLSFAHTMGEFGVVLMVGGNIPGVTKVASIAIYDEVQAMNYSGANMISLALLFISFSVLLIVYMFNRKTVRAV
jgi:molybdate transport system permease protein